MANVDYDGRYAQEQANMANNLGQQMWPMGVCDPGHSHGIYDPGHCHGILDAPPMMHPDDFNRMYGMKESQMLQREAEFKKMVGEVLATKQLPRAKIPWQRIEKEASPLKDDPNAAMILRDGPPSRVSVLMKAKVPLAVKQVKKALPSMMLTDQSPHMRYEAWKTLP